MKFLFIVQGEGRGHLTQALALESMLTRAGHTVTGMLVGKSDSRKLPDFFVNKVKAPIKRFESPNFQQSVSNQRNQITQSVIYNLMKTPTYLQSIKQLKELIYESKADVVMNFYEILTGLAYALYRIDIPQICIGHQYLFLHKDFSLPDINASHYKILQYFTRITCLGAKGKLALSFCDMPEDPQEGIKVVPPVLRKEVYGITPEKGSYIHGYMLNSGFADFIDRWHKEHPDTELRFFWDRKNEPEIKKVDDTLSFYQLNDTEFLRQMGGCMAYASTAGFESICEAMLLEKPIMMVPAHIEQDCNAYDAARNGAGIVTNDFDISKLIEYAQDYVPNKEFGVWARSAEEKILDAIKGFVSLSE